MIEFNVQRQTLTQVNPNIKIVRYSREYLKAFFNFSGDWKGTIKVAIFTAGNHNYEIPIDSDNTCLMPWSVTDEEKFTICVLGTDAKRRITTNNITITTIATGAISGEVPPAPPADIYQEISSKAQNALDKATDVERRANAGEFNGSQGPKGDTGPQGEPGEDGAPGLPGTDGKSIYVGDTAPDPGQYPIWIDPSQTDDTASKAYVDAGLAGKQDKEGEWELIEEFKTDALAAVDKTKEPDGTPYHFSAVRVKVTYAGEEKNNIPLSFYAYDAGLTKNKSVGGIYVPLAASEGTLEMTTEIDGGRWKTIYNPASDHVAAFYKPMLLEKTSQEISAAEYNHVGKIACWDVVQPNTTFRIEAVRFKEVTANV